MNRETGEFLSKLVDILFESDKNYNIEKEIGSDEAGEVVNLVRETFPVLLSLEREISLVGPGIS